MSDAPAEPAADRGSRFRGAIEGLEEVEDLFHARTATFAFHRTRLEFDLARSVFASANIDPGSGLLLRYLQTLHLDEVERVLDVGCGHGTLGAVLRALDRDRRVTFVDRDALACRYTARNLAANDLSDPATTVHGSLGYDDLDPGPRFDLIVSNLPGKAGEAVLTHLVRAAATVVREGGLIGFVVVQPLAELLRRLLTDPAVELLVDKGNKTHQVFIARQQRIADPAADGAFEPGGFDHGIYDRASVDFEQGNLCWRARTVTGIDEFDNLAQPTRLLRTALQGVRAGPSTIVNAGQGHRAVIAALAGYPPATLVSRDLLSLRATVRCLADAGIAAPGRLVHDIGLPGPDGGDANGTPDDSSATPAPALTILHADDKVHGPWLTGEVTRYLHGLTPPVAGGMEHQLVLTGRAGILGRLEADLLRRRRGHIAYKKSVRGHRVLRFVPAVRPTRKPKPSSPSPSRPPA